MIHFMDRCRDELDGKTKCRVPSSRQALLINLPPDLLGMAGFRERLEVLLDEDAVIGTVAVHEKGNTRSLAIRWKDEDSREGAVAELDPSAPRPVSESSFRACDDVAWLCWLPRVAGAPEFDLAWPQPRRDEAIEACREALKRLGR